MGRLRGKVVTSWWFESLFGGISSRFLLADHFHLLASESVFGMSQGPPTCACSSLSQDGLQRRGLWVTDITHYEVTTPLPLLTSKEPFCACIVGEVFLTSRTRNRWPFISYLDRAQPPPSSCYYGGFVQPEALLSPASILFLTVQVKITQQHLYLSSPPTPPWEL